MAHPAGLPVRTLSETIAVSLWSRIVLETGDGWDELDDWMTVALNAGVRLSDPVTAGQAVYWLAGLRFAARRYRDTRGLLAEAELQLERHDPVGSYAGTRDRGSDVPSLGTWDSG